MNHCFLNDDFLPLPSSLCSHPEQSAVGSLQRVEGMAADELNMRTPKASEIIMVRQ